MALAADQPHVCQKACINPGLHDARQGELAGIAAKLRAYRPAATVLEAEVAPARTGDGGTGAAGRGGPQMFLEVMRLKRHTHDSTIQVHTCF